MARAARHRRTLGLLVSFAVGWPGSALAAKTDTVVLANGDRITGEVKGLASGKLDYSTDDAGRLSIEWERVVRVQSPHVFEVELGSGRKLLGTLAPGKEDGLVAVDGVSGDTVRITSVVTITPLSASFLQRMKGYLDVGFTIAKANQATTFSLGGEAEYRGPKMGGRFAFDSYSQGQESEPTTRRNAATLTAGWFLPKRWSAFGIGVVEQNDELDLDLRVTGGGGFSRVLARSNRMDLTSALGLVATGERFDVGGDSASAVEERSSLEGLLFVTWNAFRFDSPKLDFSTGVELYPGITEKGRFRGEVSLRLKYELFTDFNVGIKLSDTFDSGPPEEDIATNDYVATLTIGWSYRR